MPFRQRVADYIEEFHSTSSLARELMPAEEAAAFDEAIADWSAVCRRRAVELTIVADLAWGPIANEPLPMRAFDLPATGMRTV